MERYHDMIFTSTENDTKKLSMEFRSRIGPQLVHCFPGPSIVYHVPASFEGKSVAKVRLHAHCHLHGSTVGPGSRRHHATQLTLAYAKADTLHKIFPRVPDFRAGYYIMSSQDSV